MAVTKRIRFEVLRRDEHTCQYCGAKAPDATLQIDHVVPVALGGDDKPGNLVTACRDCNSGKASIPPDSPMVQSLSAEAAAYALGMTDKMTRFRADVEAADQYAAEFHLIWDGWGIGEGDDRVSIPLPYDWKMTMYRWMRMGVPIAALRLAVPTAMTKPGLSPERTFSYFAGIVWNMVNEREIDYTVTDETAAVYTADEGMEIYNESYSSGMAAGTMTISRLGHAADYLARHIDAGLAPHKTFEDDWVAAMYKHHYFWPELAPAGGDG